MNKICVHTPEKESICLDKTPTVQEVYENLGETPLTVFSNE